MVKDWYDEGVEPLMLDLQIDTELTLQTVKDVYAMIYNYGLIDYDVEKDIIRARYHEEYA